MQDDLPGRRFVEHCGSLPLETVVLLLRSRPLRAGLPLWMSQAVHKIDTLPAILFNERICRGLQARIAKFQEQGEPT